MTTSIATGGLERAVRALGSAEFKGSAAAEQGAWVATRVGRNDVWRLAPRTAPGEAYFAKFYRSTAEFRRELGGLRIARRMAEGRDWLMAAEVLTADQRDRFIVTAAMPGTALRGLVRTALRLGRASPARQAAMEQARHALSLLADWVGLLQGWPPQAVDEPQDDRPAAVAGRIAAKVERLGPGWAPAGAAPRPAIPEDRGALVPTHGDLSFGNVFYHEGRVGIVDFENMGLGPDFRDIIWIRYGLEQCNFRWYYRDSAPLLGLLAAPGPDDPLAGLYRMEFVVDHLLILEARLAARPWSERALGLAERRWARREFSRLARLLAGG